ncbi:MAG TPA: polysaccharide deacetylase family protein [Chitinophagaceae bacterium]|nr:polysaccharide deacetylase family protein [Chitinophagaceae bacterium]
MSKGIFTISLDFELFWGVRDHRTLESYGENIRNVHQVVPRLLQLFSQYNVHCTWATVGFLFFNEKKEMMSFLPAERPAYQKKEYDPYSYIEQNELEKIYHFAPALIEQIKKTPGQEIGTHTFSHFYTLEKNTTIGQFRSDLRSAIAIAKEKGIEIKSIVFPRNQYSNEHINACLEEGIKIYRGNELSGAYKPISREKENIFRKGVRFADTYINITGHHCYAIPAASDIINVPASRFLRPYNPKFKMFDGLKLRRIKQGIKFAAKHGLVYQLWWHPHNFGKYMDENLKFLEQVLKFYHQLNQEEKIESQNMLGIYSNIK